MKFDWLSVIQPGDLCCMKSHLFVYETVEGSDCADGALYDNRFGTMALRVPAETFFIAVEYRKDPDARQWLKILVDHKLVWLYLENIRETSIEKVLRASHDEQ